MLTVSSRVRSEDFNTEIGIGTSWADSARFREVTRTVEIVPSAPPSSASAASAGAGAEDASPPPADASVLDTLAGALSVAWANEETAASRLAVNKTLWNMFF